MRNQSDIYAPTGFLEIWKHWNDGRREKVFSERNTIVSGLGVGLAHMFTGSGSDRITDFQITWFQVGTSGYTSYDTTTYKLQSPLSSIDQYGVNGDSNPVLLSQIQNGVVVTNQTFCKIPFNLIKRVSNTSVEFNLILSNNVANNLTLPLNEVGLFMHNPKKLTPAATILCAYKKFQSIEKTSDFALVFKWTLNF